MEKLSRYFPVLAILSFLILFVVLVYSNNRLNEAIDRLEFAEHKIDATLETLAGARAIIDTVKKDLTKFGVYVKDIQGRVEIMDLNQRSADNRFRNQKSEISGRLKSLYRELETTGKELPEIPIVEVARVENETEPKH